MATKFITVSIDIMHDKNLNLSQKFILAEIGQLVCLDSGCIASNSHFSRLIGIAKESVSRNINKLKEDGYINIKIVSGSRNHTRVITLNKMLRPPYQNVKTPLTKDQETKGNITLNRTINIHGVFEKIWKKYQQHLKSLGRRGGNKQKALANYMKLRKKYTDDDIVGLVSTFYGVTVGAKNLENILKEIEMKDYLGRIHDEA